MHTYYFLSMITVQTTSVAIILYKILCGYTRIRYNIPTRFDFAILCFGFCVRTLYIVVIV